MKGWAAIAGTLVLAGCWLGPLPGLVHRSFTAHMTLHMAVVAVAAPLLALGLAGGRWDPARHLPRLFAPLPAMLAELAVVWGWHAPALHEAVRRSERVLSLEQASFFLVGLVLWLAVLGGAPARRTERSAAGVAALLLTSMHMTLLGALLALSTRPLYEHATAAPAGWTALEDQQLGGAVMLVVGGASYLAGGVALTAGVLGGSGLRLGARP